MIPWTTRFSFLGFRVETCDYGGLWVGWEWRRFVIAYSRSPDYDAMERANNE
jgi:hypothetical protein